RAPVVGHELCGDGAGRPATRCHESRRPRRAAASVPADDAPAFPLTAPALTARVQRAPTRNTIITPATISTVATPIRQVTRSRSRRNTAASTTAKIECEFVSGETTATLPRASARHIVT